MVKLQRYFFLSLIVVLGFAASENPNKSYCNKEITTLKTDANITLAYLKIPCVNSEGWDTLNEVNFWRCIITLSKDSSMANIFESRTLLKTFSRGFIDTLEQHNKLDSLRVALCTEYNLPAGTRIKFTGGKKWFYDFNGVSTKLARAITVFDSLGVDPFYAQSVLLIESPGTSRAKSVAGAYGHFQLMPFVATQYGLRVDRYVDERENFDRSAYAAARLFKEICVPYARRWCELYGFAADEKALWFKLLALHCYNAGATTVKLAMQVVPNSYQGKNLIQKLWHTSYGRFQSEAQNYSQIALACYLEYEKFLSAHKTVSVLQYEKY
ncbi:MAG: transglycosylase SLT domain-containing protein [Bacteroidia bacterium]|nr:transglycosylase SLT domain-containing protein [Bacteroidia bacterium]